MQFRVLGEGPRDTPWEVVVGATMRRFRPIVLTAAAAVLIPVIRSDFFGPMVVAMMGGLTIATGPALLFLPALYAARCRVVPGVVNEEAASA